MKYARLVLVFFAFHLFGTLYAQQVVDGVVQGGVVRPLVIAIPDFHPENDAATQRGRDIGDVVSNDLRSTGLFRDLPKEAMLEGAGSFDAPLNYGNWSGVGAEIMLKGAVAESSDGQMQVKFRIFDVVAGTELGEGIQFNGNTGDWRRIAHKVADTVYSRITGEGPYFDSRIVFVDESGPKDNRTKRIAIMDSDGANLRYLTTGNDLVLAPRWSNNARDIIFTSYASGSPQVVLMNTATGATSVLTELPGLAFAPRYTPDGRALVVSLIDDAGNTDLFRIDLATGTRTRLTSASSIETAPSFSPDGARMVFESDRTGSQQLFVMPSAGGDATQISKGAGRYATPVWSPRGDLIAFTKIEGGQFHIGVMNTDGSGERILTASFIDEAPSWAPNGRVLTFFRETSGRDGAPEAYTISLTGQNLVQLPTPNFASDPSWSPLLN